MMKNTKEWTQRKKILCGLMQNLEFNNSYTWMTIHLFDLVIKHYQLACQIEVIDFNKSKWFEARKLKV